MRKLLVLALSVLLAASSMLAIGVASAEEVVATKVSDNLVLELAPAPGMLLDSYQVDGAANRPYPDNFGMKVGKVGDVVTFVDNSGVATALNAHVASYMPLSVQPTSDFVSYTASASATGVHTSAWGGFGILFGTADGDPLALFMGEHEGATAISIAAKSNEYFHFFAVPEEAEVPAFALDVTYDFSVTVSSDGTTEISVNGALVETVDLSEFEIVPAVGTNMKNYRAEYTDFSLVVETEALNAADFDSAENLFAEGIGLYDSYSVDSATYQPYPADFGIKVAKVNGSYTLTDNNMAPRIVDAHVVSYFGTSKDVSAVSAYRVSAKIKPVVKSNWGGLGLLVGKMENDAPIVVWAGLDSQAVYLAYDFNEFKFAAQADEGTFELNKEFTMAVVVDEGLLSIYIDGELLAATDISGLDFVPAIGTDMKNYRGQYRHFEFKTLDTGLSAAKYTVTFISGQVEIGSKEYTFGEGAQLGPIERTGYNFGGWKLLPDLSSQSITSVGANVAGDITVYCEYKLKNYTITYFDGETEIESGELDKTYNMNSYIPLGQPAEKEGYTFDGWFDNSELTGSAIAAIQIGNTGDKVFYAKYSPEGTGGDNGDDKPPRSCGNANTASLAYSFTLLLCGAAVGLLRKLKA